MPQVTPNSVWPSISLRHTDVRADCLLTECLAPLQTVKMGVQYSLWGGSVMNLGTEQHKKLYFEDIDKYRLPGKAFLLFLSTVLLTVLYNLILRGF